MKKTISEKALARFAVISVDCIPEDAKIEGNASAIDPATDAEIAKGIREQLDAGNPWAWCIVQVSARYAGYTESAYLGCCSYESEEDFRKNSGYFEDMKAEAISDLAAMLEESIKDVAKVLV